MTAVPPLSELDRLLDAGRASVAVLVLDALAAPGRRHVAPGLLAPYRARVALSRARDCTLAGDDAGAEAALCEALRADPRNPAAIGLQAIGLLESGRVAQAAAALRQAAGAGVTDATLCRLLVLATAAGSVPLHG